MKRIAAVVIVLGIMLGVAPPSQALTHLGATDNVALAIKWRQALLPDGSPFAILVRSDSFADSLAAGALAGFIGAPVLMNPPGGALDDRVAAELSAMGADTVLVIGGTAAVSDATEADLEAEGYIVNRYAGDNRIATAVAVFEQVALVEDSPIYDSSTVVFLARGFGDGSSAFADSLGAGMLAGTTGGPLLLTETATLSSETRAAIQSASGLTDAVIVGGTAAVSQAIENELTSMGLIVERIAGENRFETAARTADRSFNGTPGDIVAMVEGLNANSWASGYPASVSSGGAVVLADGDTLPDATASFLSSQPGGELYCAPEVSHTACLAADGLLNGG